MKNKGLGISILTRDWDQLEQRVKRSNQYYKKFNKILTDLEEQILYLKCEEQTESNIDLIVTSILNNTDIQEIKNRKQLFRSIFYDKIEEFDISMNKGSVQNYKSTLARFNEFEKTEKINLTISVFSKSYIKIVNSYIKFERKQGKLDSTIQNRLKYWNGCINNYNLINNSLVPKIQFKHFKWIKRTVQKFSLHDSELRSLFHFAVNSEKNPNPELYRDPKKIRRLLFFLFRCFTGMRISEMIAVNCNEKSLDLINNDSFTYSSSKGAKIVSVPLIANTLLFQLASELDFKFPSRIHSVDKNEERDAVNEFYKAIIGENRTYSIQLGNKIEMRPIAGNITSHTARRTYAQLIYKKKGDIYFTSQVLGHSSISVTQDYLGLASTDKFKDYEDLFKI